MRKTVLERHLARTAFQPDENWLEVERLATVQVTSEDPAFPIESVFRNNGGWRAAKDGEQAISLVFDEPQTLHRIRLRFSETEIARTQQFVLRWSGRENKGSRKSFASNGISVQAPLRKNSKIIT